MKTILVPTVFLEKAPNSISYAREFARHRSLLLLNGKKSL
jgi:hypothetical protein